MLRALAIKELRETFGIALLALILFMYVAIRSMEFRLVPLLGYYGGNAIPFVSCPFEGSFSLFAAIFAVALGLRQTVVESAGSTYLFLLHRPLGRRKMLAVKLCVGLGLCLVLGAIPILALAWWAAMPGTHASPFVWSMTSASWKAWIAMPTVYLGAFLSGLRPGAWIGSRLFPLAGAGLVAYCVRFAPWWWILGLGGLLLLNVLLLVNIFTVARVRDYP